MKDLMQRSSFRGKNILESVTRALSPSRNRPKSPNGDDKAGGVTQSRKVRNGSEKKENNHDKAKNKTPSVTTETKGMNNVSRKNMEKQKRSASDSSSGNKSDVSSKSSGPELVLDFGPHEKKPDQNLGSSSGASSEDSGKSTPTKPGVAKLSSDDPVVENEYDDDTEESMYMSRKLLFRKMIELEVKELGKADDIDVTSVADSWDDLEENFAKIYEPIPAHVNGSKKQKKSRSLSSDSHHFEVTRLQNGEVFYDANYFLLERDEKSQSQHLKYNTGNHEMRDSGFSPTSEHEVFAEVHRSQSDSSDSEVINKEPDGSASREADYEIQTDLYRNIRNLRNSLARRQQQKQQEEDADSWKSLATDEEPVYVSRSEILSRHELSPLPDTSRSSALSGATRAIRSSRKFISRSEILARLDQVREVEESRDREVEESGAVSPGAASMVSSQDSWSIKEHELLHERTVISTWGLQNGREEFVTLQPNGGSILDFEADQSCSEIEDRDCYGLVSGRDRRHELRQAAAAELQRRVMAVLATQQHIAPSTKTKVMDIIKQHIDNNSDSLDYAQFEEKNEEIRRKLKEALAHDWETLSNINLGLIYVPMEESFTLRSKKSGASRDVSDYDTFGSLDSLIFEPKVPSEDAISEASENMSISSDASQHSASMNALPQSGHDAEAEFKSIGKVQSLVSSFDDIHSGRCMTYDPKSNETSITNFKVGNIVKRLQKSTVFTSRDELKPLSIVSDDDSPNEKDNLNRRRRRENGHSAQFVGPSETSIQNLHTYENDQDSGNGESKFNSHGTSIKCIKDTKSDSKSPSNDDCRGSDGSRDRSSCSSSDPQDCSPSRSPDQHDPLTYEVSAVDDLPASSKRCLSKETSVEVNKSSLEPPPLPRKPSNLRSTRSYSSGSSDGRASVASREAINATKDGSIIKEDDLLSGSNNKEIGVRFAQNAHVPKSQLKKFFSGLAGLGFKKFSSKEILKAENNLASRYSKQASHIDAIPQNMSKNTSLANSRNIYSISGNGAFDLQTASAVEEWGELLPKESDGPSSIVSEMNHYEAPPVSATMISFDSESDSITSVESVIFKGTDASDRSSVAEAGLIENKKVSNKRDKYVVNHGHESDTSEFDKSASVSTAFNIDSDTSWDYVRADKTNSPDRPPAAASASLSIAGESVCGSSESIGPRVVGNLRRKQNDANIVKPISTNIEQFFNELRCHEELNQSDAEEKSQLNVSVCPDVLLSIDSDSDNRNRYDVNTINTNSSDSSTPPVLLLKHHSYASAESLASRCQPHLKDTEKCNGVSSELQVYGSRNGEPLYGARNSLVFQTMNGAYVTRDPPANFQLTPLIIRKGKAVEITEEMFKTSDLPSNTEKDSKPDDCEELKSNDTDTNGEDNGEALESHGKPISENEVVIDNDTAVQSSESRPEPSIPDAPRTREDQQMSASDLNSQVQVESDSGKHLSDSIDKFKRVQKVGVSVMGEKNNDMIRELKLKLRRKFIASESDDDDSETKTSVSLVQNKEFACTDGVSSVASKREQLAPQMSRIFGSFYEKRRQSLTAHNSIDDSRDSPKPDVEGNTEVVDTSDQVKSHSLKDSKTCDSRERESLKVHSHDGAVEQVWLPTPDYTPLSTLPRPLADISSLPQNPMPRFDVDDLENVSQKIKFDQRVPTPDYDCTPTPCPECDGESYCSSQPAGEKTTCQRLAALPKRSVRFDMVKHLEEGSVSWSDMESVIFAEDRSFGSVFVDGGNRAFFHAEQHNGGRMDSYQDGLLWDQMVQMRRSRFPEDRERWEMEKTKRMLLWIHMSTNDEKTQRCYRSFWWKAKQRASVMWIVQKANKNKVPADLQDPYYRDHEGREHLKPGIVAQLANADLYCSALANIYGDPNFFSLSHWKVIQALARKGVYVAEPTDVALNETILLQDSPLKMSAHLAVIEAMMALYIREVVVAERVVSTLQKISGPNSTHATPHDQEEALVLWVAKVTAALQERVAAQITDDAQQLPEFPRIQDLSDLSDGIGLAALISFYCPQELPWGDIAVADPPSMADSLYNIGLVIKFCHEALPYNPCLLTKEDIVYMHSSVKQNVLAFVTELFFLLELQPVACVAANTRRPSSKYTSPSATTLRESSTVGNTKVSEMETPDCDNNPRTGSCASESRESPAADSISDAHVDLRRQYSREELTGCGLKRQLSLGVGDEEPAGKSCQRRDSRIAVHDGNTTSLPHGVLRLLLQNSHTALTAPACHYYYYYFYYFNINQLMERICSSLLIN
ncbi:Calmodulin-regulated spectrin-associated protein CH domain [Trinorchestia longiramus]|nr:Calmodulin-regulated spectrin-associated protein CH domain [Trinorchestia longiramus]